MKKSFLFPLVALVIHSTMLPQSGAMRQFDESVARVQRCLRGECTKTEALKAARDVGIAAVAVVTLAFVGRTAAQKAARYMDPFKKGDLVYYENHSKIGVVESYDPRLQMVKIGDLSESMGTKKVTVPMTDVEKASGQSYTFKKGSEFFDTLHNKTGIVEGFDPSSNVVIMKDHSGTDMWVVPARYVKQK